MDWVKRHDQYEDTPVRIGISAARNKTRPA